MKYIYLTLLLAFSALNSNDSQYVGIIKHTLSESIVNNSTIIFPCEKEITVYQHDKETNRFNQVSSISEKYYNSLDPDLSLFIKDSLDTSSPKFLHVMHTSLHVKDNNTHAKIHFVFESSHGKQNIPLGAVMAIPPQSDSAIMISAVFHGNYLPGTSYKGCMEMYRKSLESPLRRGYSQQMSSPIDEIVDDITKPLDYTENLKTPGHHPVSQIVAFLKFIKKEDQYIPVPGGISFSLG